MLPCHAFLSMPPLCCLGGRGGIRTDLFMVALNSVDIEQRRRPFEEGSAVSQTAFLLQSIDTLHSSCKEVETSICRTLYTRLVVLDWALLSCVLMCWGLGLECGVHVANLLEALPANHAWICVQCFLPCNRSIELSFERPPSQVKQCALTSQRS